MDVITHIEIIVNSGLLALCWLAVIVLSISLALKMKSWPLLLPGAGALPYAMFYAFIYINAIPFQTGHMWGLIGYSRLSNLSLCFSVFVSLLFMRKAIKNGKQWN